MPVDIRRGPRRAARRAESSWLWLGLVAAGFALYLFRSEYTSFYYDASGYWTLASSYYDQGRFHFYHYHSQLRGYLFPLLYYPLYGLLRGHSFDWCVLAVKAVGAGWAGLVFGVLGPATWQAATGTARLSWRRRLAFAVLGFAFWRGYFNFPLTDFPALAALLGALLLALRRPASVWAALGAGLLTAAAIYTRSAYLLALPPVAVLLLLGPAAGGWRRGLCGLGFAAGLLLVGWPQFVLNRHHFCSHSWLVLGQAEEYRLNRGRPDLLLWQLNAGLHMQRYETAISRDYPTPEVRFTEPVGRVLLSRAGTPVLRSYAEYAAFAARHPVDVLGLYARHLFNGLDLQYPTPYLRRVYQDTTPLALLNYSVLFGALLVLLGAQRRPGWPALLTAAALVLPCLLSLPLAMECRYLMPLHLLLLATLCFGWPAAWRWRRLAAGRRLQLAAVYLLFLGACFTLSGSVQATLQFGPKTFQP